MNIKKITEKLKDVLSAEDLQSIQEEITSIISEQVDTRVEVEKSTLEEHAEDYCKIQIDEKVAEIKKELEEAAEIEKDKLEESLVDKLDKYLDLEISTKLDDDLLKSIAVNETLEPLVNGIKSLFEDKYVALDSEGEGLVREAQERVEELEEKNADLINDKIKLTEDVELASIKLLISEKTQDLTEVERDRVKTMSEGKDFEELYDKIDTYVDIVLEQEKSSDKVISEDADAVSDDECLSEKKIDVTHKDTDENSNSIKLINGLL